MKPVNRKGQASRRDAKSVHELIGGLLEPILAKRAGMTLNLLSGWESLMGDSIGRHTRPEKIQWPRRVNDLDPFEPATLILACESSHAILVQHETDQIIDKVNGFFGFDAIRNVKIRQKPVGTSDNVSTEEHVTMTPDLQERVDAIVGDVDDPELRNRLRVLGERALSRKRGT